MHMRNGYIGTYFSEDSKGVYRFTFDDGSGQMTAPELFYEAKNAKWVSLLQNRLVFPIEKERGAGTCFLELENGGIRESFEMLEENSTPCYILQDGGLIYTANYHDGTVMVYRIKKDGPEVAGRLESGEKAGCHQILLHESWLMVPCLEQNRIRLFDRTNGYVPAGEIRFPEGCGPRHGIFNAAHTKFYLVSEWSNELFLFGVKGKEFSLLQKLPVLPKGNGGAAAAAIRLTCGERFLYLSVRGENLLAAVDVSREKAFISGYYTSGGAHPRDFILSGDERFLLTANRQAGGIVCQRRDPDRGRLEGIESRIEMPEAVSLVLEEA